MTLDLIIKIITPIFLSPVILFTALALGHLTGILPRISFGSLSSNGRNNPVRVKIKASLSYVVKIAVLAQELCESRTRGLNPVLLICFLLNKNVTRRNMNIFSHEVETQAWSDMTEATLNEKNTYRLKEAGALKHSSSYAGSFDDMTIAEIATAMAKNEKKALAYWQKNKTFIIKTVENN